MKDFVRYDDAYIERIIAEYSDMVYKLAYAQMRNKSDADDIYQEVFLRFIRRKPVLETSEHERAWFIRVTVNCCKNLWNTAFRRHTQPLEEIPVPFVCESGNQLIALLEQLPKLYRPVVHLFYYEDMTVAEISEVLHRQEGTVRVQLNRARHMLKDIMEGEEANAGSGI